MKLSEKSEVKYLNFNSLNSMQFITHGFSTRHGGVSEGIYSSMNLTFSSGDNPENIKENYRRFCDALEINVNSLVFASQTHTNNVIKVSDEDRGKGIFKPKEWDNIDGLITNSPDTFLVTLFADCIPLFFVDPVKKAIGLSHAGWKGTLNGIASNTIQMMQSEFGCNPKDIIAAIGPGIEMNCYEVDETVAKEFYKLPGPIIKNCIAKSDMSSDNSDSDFDGARKYFIDLPGINKNLMINEGINPENIEMSGICTKCNSELLFSHRATKGKRGGMAAILGMKYCKNEN